MEEGIAVIDKDFTIVETNPAACRWFGREREEITGKHCYEVYHNLSNPCSDRACVVKEVLAAGKPVRVTHEYVRNGRKFYFEICASQLKKNKAAQVATVFRDVTEKVEDEREAAPLQKINNMLNAGAGQEEVFKEVLDGLTSVFGYRMPGIHLVSKEGDKLICRAYSFDSAIVREIERLTGTKALGYEIPLYERSLLTKIVRSKEPLITDDIAEVVRSHTDKRALQALANRDIERLSKFARQVGLAVERAEMYEDLQKKTKELEKKVEELERFRKATVKREFRMAELKKEIETLKDRVKEQGR